MATSSERSPPPFPDSEDQDVLEEVEEGRDSDEDEGDSLFVSASSPPVINMDPKPTPASQPIDVLMEPPIDIQNDPLIQPISCQTESKPGTEAVSEASDEFVDLTNNLTEVAVVADAAAAKDRPSDPPSDDFFDIMGSETRALQAEAVVKDAWLTGPPAVGKPAVKEAPTVPIINLGDDPSASGARQPPDSDKILDPLVDLLSDSPPPDDGMKPSKAAAVELFEDEGSDLFADPQQIKSAKHPQKSLFGEPDEDLFGEPLGAAAKQSNSKELNDKAVPSKAAAAPLPVSNPKEPADIFTEEATSTAPTIRNTSTVISKANGVSLEEEPDIFTEATVELSLDSPRGKRKEVTSKPSVLDPSDSASASLVKPQPADLDEVEEEEEQDDKFDIFVSVKDPEKIGDGMNAYMAYKVSTETTLSMFRNKTFTVKRRFSDFLGLYQKLSEKHGPNGFIVPPPPEKSILGMTKVKVGKEDSSSTDFVERRRGALERYLQRVVNHPSLLQDPDVREFLEREELPRAVSTQALSGAGFLKMINRATDAVSKMTIKMNESDVWFEEKLQEVESADQHFRKLHALVEALVVHRKELSFNTASFAKSAAMLGSAEDNTALSRALSQLAEVEDKMEQLHQVQAENDTFCFAELIADYIRLLGAVKGSFDQRMKAWQRWQDAQAMLQKKRETEAKLLWANKPDKLQLAKEEIVEWEAKVTQFERDFERVSATVRKEVVRFEKEKAKNFKSQIIKYLESLLQSQQQLIKYWDAFLPEAKAIA